MDPPADEECETLYEQTLVFSRVRNTVQNKSKKNIWVTVERLRGTVPWKDQNYPSFLISEMKKQMSSSRPDVTDFVMLALLGKSSLSFHSSMAIACRALTGPFPGLGNFLSPLSATGVSPAGKDLSGSVWFFSTNFKSLVSKIFTWAKLDLEASPV